jgi:hypothetical protein
MSALPRCLLRIVTFQQPRHRREHVGALIQIDGSDHRWVEDRAARSDRAQKPVMSKIVALTPLKLTSDISRKLARFLRGGTP